MNLLAVVPCSVFLGLATDDLMRRTLGALVYMTFGYIEIHLLSTVALLIPASNAAQLIISVLLLRSKQINILQMSLIGSVVSNMLLMLGLAFVLGGYNRFHQQFNLALVQAVASQLLLAIASLIIPTAYAVPLQAPNNHVLLLSCVAACLLVVLYGAFLLFQTKTHRVMFMQASLKVAKRRFQVEEGEVLQAFARIGAGIAATSGGEINQENLTIYRQLEDLEPQFSVPVTIGTLVLFTALISFHTEFVSNSVSGFLQNAGISQSFTTLTLLPILSNDPITCVAAYKDRMDLSIAYTLGKCVQIVLFVTPFCVILGRMIGVPMSMHFGWFEIGALFFVDSDGQFGHFGRQIKLVRI
ncbi:hypothetical protein VTN77DRAFT_2776 [Rasamsonia byssochlamydoides]|uniref:uncharacterized protein n=1 Tax=Rasamsonia byssochlamydoides TaxID=89139 RepID=UPI003742A8E3